MTPATAISPGPCPFQPILYKCVPEDTLSIFPT
jgi:hypothetical protein